MYTYNMYVCVCVCTYRYDGKQLYIHTSEHTKIVGTYIECLALPLWINAIFVPTSFIRSVGGLVGNERIWSLFWLKHAVYLQRKGFL